jgi:pimeloyl-ACP methyl ester carboxylesterase
MKPLYKSPVHKKVILKIYQEKLDELNIDYHFKEVMTQFGKTNIVVTGNAKNPPLVLVHGSNGCAPIGLEIFPKLAQKYQVFAVDVIAQPNRSSETRPSMKDNSYGKWMNEVMEKMNLKGVTMVGFSFGGLIIWKTLVENESRIKEAFLICPAGIVNGNPLKAIFKVFIPMKRYMWTKKIKFVERFLSALFTERDEFAVKFLSKVFLDFEMDFSPIPTIKENEAKKITIPLTIIGADDDLIFPGEKLLKRAKSIFPSLKKEWLLNDSKHVQRRVDNQKIEALILNSI